MTKNTLTHVVLTGGIGSRLWPLSRKSQPKQYLELFEGQSLFEKTVVRNEKVSDKMIVVGNIENYKMSNAILSKFDQPYVHIIEAVPCHCVCSICITARGRIVGYTIRSCH